MQCLSVSTIKPPFQRRTDISAQLSKSARCFPSLFSILEQKQLGVQEKHIIWFVFVVRLVFLIKFTLLIVWGHLLALLYQSHRGINSSSRYLSMASFTLDMPRTTGSRQHIKNKHKPTGASGPARSGSAPPPDLVRPQSST